MLSNPRLHRRSFLKRAALAAAALPLGERLLAAARAAAPDEPVDLGLAPQLFLDDSIISASSGLKSHLHRPAKAGLIEEGDGRPWELGDQIAVVRDAAGRFHMTYRYFWWDPSVRDLNPNIGSDKAHWFRETTGYAVSEDGIRWTKPVLGLIEAPAGFRRAPEARWKDGVFREPAGFSRENNLGSPIYNIQDLQRFGGVADRRRRYLINSLKRADTHPFAEVSESGLYFAPDVPDVRSPRWREGLETIWEGKRRGPRGPAVRVAGFDERDNVWFECTQASLGAWRGRGGRDIARWTSQELREWSSEELVLPVASDESRAPRDRIEYMDMRALKVAGVWLGQLIIFHGDRSDPQAEMPTIKDVWRKGTTELRLVLSRDAGKTWQRLGGKETWLPCHEAEDGYDRLVFAGSPVRVGDELWLYYACWDGDHLAWNKDGTTYYKDRMRTSRTARAVLRWDGYLSLRAGGEPGLVATRPLTAPGGRRLAVNAAAGKGSVRVEMQDAGGRPHPGFALADCHPLAADGLSQVVTWGRKPDLPPAVMAKPVRLRFEVKEADLYGFELSGA